jgi:hypothetical protein
LTPIPSNASTSRAAAATRGKAAFSSNDSATPAIAERTGAKSLRAAEAEDGSAYARPASRVLAPNFA